MFSNQPKELKKNNFSFKNWKLSTLLFTIKKLSQFVENYLQKGTSKNLKINFFNLLEPIIGTAMMTSLSLICKSF